MSSISKVCNGTTKSARGLGWRFSSKPDRQRRSADQESRPPSKGTVQGVSDSRNDDDNDDDDQGMEDDSTSQALTAGNSRPSTGNSGSSSSSSHASLSGEIPSMILSLPFAPPSVTYQSPGIDNTTEEQGEREGDGGRGGKKRRVRDEGK